MDALANSVMSPLTELFFVCSGIFCFGACLTLILKDILFKYNVYQIENVEIIVKKLMTAFLQYYSIKKT
jgi:hypothetical protein